ncbi:MAG TPA: flippase [Gemmatimonadaceae bacterium]|jgi:O-antigen/teichoic acid export membrane protein
MTTRFLARNVLFNLAAQVIPLAAAIVAIPRLIQALGASDFGILTLVWGAIGYFGLFDFGLGRALTHAIAVRLGNGETGELGAVTWTGLALMTVFGCAGGLLLGALTPLLVDHALNVPAASRNETLTSFYIMAAAIPVTLLATGFRGILEAFQDFPIASLLRVPLAMLNYLGPLAALPFSHRLPAVVLALASVRVLGCALHATVCFARYKFLRDDLRMSRRLVTSLLRYGGWLTITNVVSPLMVTLDRFLIGALLPMAAVAYYVTPFEMVTKLFIVPVALLGVLFPAFATTFARDRERTTVLVDRGVRAVLLVVFPATLAMACFAHEGLQLWINAEFSREGAAILQWLAVGVLINCPGQVFFTALQGVGRPDLTARVHLIELPIYVAMIWLLTHAFGLVGVAIAWTLRVTLDTTLLLLLTARALPDLRAALARCAAVLTTMVAGLALISQVSTFEWRCAGFLLDMVIAVAGGWIVLLTSQERETIRRAITAASDRQ